MDDIVPPEIPPGRVVHLTSEQMRQIYDRTELIDQHFDRCCAHHLDKCTYGEEYDKLYEMLVAAGVPEAKTPMSRDAFEAWMAEHLR